MLEKKYSILLAVLFVVLFYSACLNPSFFELLKTDNVYSEIYFIVMAVLTPFALGCLLSFMSKDLDEKYSGDTLTKILEGILVFRIIIWREVIKETEEKLRMPRSNIEKNNQN